MHLREAVIDRMKMGKMKYGHGVRIMDDTVTWGTVKNSWLEMASEELLDAIIYVIADYLRTEEKIHDEEAKDDNNLIMHIFDNVNTVSSEKHPPFFLFLLTTTQICL